MEENHFIKLMALKSLKGFGNSKVISMLTNEQTLDNFFNSLIEKHPELKRGPNRAYEKIFQYCLKSNITLMPFYDKNYSRKLKMINSPPALLFAKGRIELLNRPSIAIVGSREVAERTIEWTKNISKELSKEDYVIISGGAKGVDAAAHLGALEENGNTICVLGCGFDNIYPKENIDLIKKIGERGLLLSEYPPFSNTRPIALLERNRITSGLSDLVLVTSCKEQGGAMSQIKTARSQNKIVLFPNPELGLTPNKGVIKFSKEKNITLVDNSNDIINSLQSINSQSILI